MPPQISKEVRQRIYELCGTKKPREILTILKLEDIDITERSIYNIKRENREAKTRNESFASFEEPFGGSFGEFGEEEANRYQLIILNIHRRISRRKTDEGRYPAGTLNDKGGHHRKK